MKQRYKYLLLLLLFACSLPSYADWNFGLMAEYNNIKLNWRQKTDEKTTFPPKKEEITDYEVNNISGFTVGAVVAYEPIKYFAVQSGLYFAMGGYDLAQQHPYGQEKEYLTESTRLYYLQVPLYLVGQLPIKKLEDQFVILFEAGPLFSGGVASNTTLTSTVGKQTVEEKRTDAFQEVLDPFDCAIHLAIGVEYMGARLLFGYNIGVYDFGKDFLDENPPVHNTITNGAFTVTAAYLF